MESKKVVIITDGTGLIQELARRVEAVIGGYQDYSATVVQADAFSGVDLLPADIFFLGCENPNPPSFQYIEALLQHINLAGRPCGIFSASSEAVKYLSLLVRDSEAAAGSFLAKNADADELSQWVKGILK